MMLQAQMFQQRMSIEEPSKSIALPIPDKTRPNMELFQIGEFELEEGFKRHAARLKSADFEFGEGGGVGFEENQERLRETVVEKVADVADEDGERGQVFEIQELEEQHQSESTRNAWRKDILKTCQGASKPRLKTSVTASPL
jgi:hypothetical protein